MSDVWRAVGLKLCVLAVAAAGLGLGVSRAESDTATWPQFHGPDRDAISEETGLLKKWPEGGPPLLWRAEGCGRGYSSLAVTEDAIYTAGAVNEQTCVIRLDLNGKRRWIAPNGEPWHASDRMRWARAYWGSRATPTVDDGLVYHLGELGRLAAFDAETGSEAWSRNVLEDFGAELPRYGYAESVLIVGDRLIVYPGGKRGYMVALDKKTGRKIWANTDIGEGASYCSAIQRRVNGRDQIITMSGDAAIGVDPTDGRLLWRHPHSHSRRINATTPVVRGGMVYITSGYGTGSVGLRVTTSGGVSATEVWATDGLDNQHGGVVCLDGYLYGAGHKQVGWTCLELATGREMWRERIIEGGSIAYADGRLYCLGERGNVALLDPTPDGPKRVSRFKLSQTDNRPFWAHPVVCRGRLYVRYDDTLFAYDIEAK